MLFNSPEFLFGFLPIVLLNYFLIGPRWRNFILFMASLLFYFTTSGELTIILFLSVLVNWALGLHLARVTGHRHTTWLVIDVLINLLALLYYKYARFFHPTRISSFSKNCAT